MKHGKCSVIVKLFMVALFVEAEAFISMMFDRYGHTETILLLKTVTTLSSGLQKV
jgi:hypothetical protein